MKVIIHQAGKREMEVAGGKKLADLARELNINLEAHLVVRGGSILTRDAFIGDEDVIEVFPAISGG
ncbi:MAG TPA: thiamine biosynthesis protein ThiS [Peptococcaceae bacterium]|nr:MAG: ThiamineS protein [Moorella sp. 60_41]HBT46654.1 thiamine biosynthesis protein ThiS [Peptococcaceae bacterium]